jgi:hypothetical protein
MAPTINSQMMPAVFGKREPFSGDSFMGRIG